MTETPIGSPARILYLMVDLPVGGAEIHLLNLVRNLDRNRFDPRVCCIGRSGPIGREIESEGIPVLELGKLKRGGFDREVLALLRTILRRDRISLLHSHLYHANLYGRLAALRVGIPAVCTVHNIYTRRKLHRNLVNRWLARHTARIIAVSSPVRDDVLRYDRVVPSNVVVIPNGVDVDGFDLSLTRQQARERLGIPKDRYVIGTLGRLEEQKGLPHLVEAIQLLSESGMLVFLLIAGSGREEGRLREMVARFGLEDSVRFLGMRRDVPEVHRAMDVFALPSLWEGLPIALLEAMASGLPVVATPVGGIPEVIRNGKNGLLVPPEDPVALAAALRRIRHDAVLAEVLGREGRETVRERYTHRRLAEHVMEVYRESLREPTVRDPG
jgi:glycosyltransferase involved in cell wall biosynthesis